jgi:hypothetical protein
VEFVLRPEPAPAVATAVELAVAVTTRDDPSRVYESRWRLAALAEAVAGLSDWSDAEDGRYALSPRNTRGAIRA